jgi:hypothetical protein
VPLPLRKFGNSKQQTAEAIRDGRKASQLIVALKGWNKSNVSRSASIATSSNNRTSRRGTSFTTFHEQDFTVPGKRSKLMCPFAVKSPELPSTPEESHHNSTMVTNDPTAVAPDMEDRTPHQSEDPICAAMYAETHASVPPSTSGSNKCPIRFLDQHSPEDIARYFETHKHEIPRSHEVCVKRYQRNEEDIKKLDAKYGNLVSMLQGLGQKHQPMLPKDEKEEEPDHEVERRSNERVENWANDLHHAHPDPADVASVRVEDEDDRESRFDRPLKEVRVGESPSRPWGIAVPYDQQPVPQYADQESYMSPPAPVMADAPSRPVGKCPFGHGAPKTETEIVRPVDGYSHHEEEQPPATEPAPTTQPAFISQSTTASPTANNAPQMVFTGPVFIGYPVDQAMALMQAWQAGTANKG